MVNISCAIAITWLVLYCYYCKHIYTCASVYSNFNVVYTQLYIVAAGSNWRNTVCQLLAVHTSECSRMVLRSYPSHFWVLATRTTTLSYVVLPLSGQYWTHLCFPNSTHLVIITTTETCFSHTIRQKSATDFFVGPGRTDMTVTLPSNRSLSICYRTAGNRDVFEAMRWSRRRKDKSWQLVEDLNGQLMTS